MDFDALYALGLGLLPKLADIMIVLGSLVVIGTGVDKALVNVAFMDKIFAIPVLGGLLKWTTKFSPFNVKE